MAAVIKSVEAPPERVAVHRPKDCWSCHYCDNVHDRRFGRYCERCHGTEAFRPATVH